MTFPVGSSLYYTTDGSTPTLANGTESSNGIFHITEGQNHVYRFRIFQDGYLPSPVITRSFIYKDKDYYLPIISVVTDDKNLYDNRIGVYVDGTNGAPGNSKNNSIVSNKNRAWERPVNFEYFVPDEEGNYTSCALNQETDFEVCGGWSRHFIPGCTSFRLKAVKQYEGINFLPYPFFQRNKPYVKNKALQVRNGGNDTSNRIIDAAIQQVVIRSGFYLDCQDTQPAHVFFNGKFQFTFNIREPANANLSYSNYGIDKDEVDEFEINGSVGYYQKSGDNKAMLQWINLAQQLANHPTDDSIYEQICDIVDIDEYCNFMAAGCYVGCSDWFTNSNNVKGYRSRQDGKFHLVFMDQDQGFENADMLGALMNRRNSHDSRYPYTNSSYLIDIFVNMLDYEPFRKKFIDAFCIVDGSVFEPSFSQQVFDDMVKRATPAMAMEGYDGNLRNSASQMLSRIRNNRGARMTNMGGRFGLSENKNVKFSANIDCASFEINGQPVPRATFDGQLFEPATITAMSPAGYRFIGWKKNEGVVISDSVQLFDKSSEWRFYDQGTLDGEDWTNPDYEAADWSQSN